MLLLSELVISSSLVNLHYHELNHSIWYRIIVWYITLQHTMCFSLTAQRRWEFDRRGNDNTDAYTTYGNTLCMYTYIYIERERDDQYTYHIYIYIYIYTCSIYIYIERERDTYTHVHMYVYIYIYIYMHTWMHTLLDSVLAVLLRRLELAPRQIIS